MTVDVYDAEDRIWSIMARASRFNFRYSACRNLKSANKDVGIIGNKTVYNAAKPFRTLYCYNVRFDVA